MFRISVLFQFLFFWMLSTVREIAIIMSSIFHVHFVCRFSEGLFLASFCLPHEADDSENKRKASPDGS